MAVASFLSVARRSTGSSWKKKPSERLKCSNDSRCWAAWCLMFPPTTAVADRQTDPLAGVSRSREPCHRGGGGQYSPRFSKGLGVQETHMTSRPRGPIWRRKPRPIPVGRNKSSLWSRLNHRKLCQSPPDAQGGCADRPPCWAENGTQQLQGKPMGQLG